MIRVRSQAAAVLCAAAFSFGAVCAVMTVFRMDSSARSLWLHTVFLTARDLPFFRAGVIFFLWPVALLLLGISPLGGLLLPAAMLLFGASAGCVVTGCAISDGVSLPLALFLVPAALSSVFLGGAVLRMHWLLQRQMLSGARYRPDLRPVFLRIILYSALFVLSAFFLIRFCILH